MVHLRLNEKETNPNSYINFITALPRDGDERESARQLLRALAAQVKPMMKAHGFTVNSFEEVRVTFYMIFLKVEPVSNALNFLSFSMNGTPYLQVETGTRERRSVSRLHSFRTPIGSLAETNSITIPVPQNSYFGEQMGHSYRHLIYSARSATRSVPTIRVRIVSHLLPRYSYYTTLLDRGSRWLSTAL